MVKVRYGGQEYSKSTNKGCVQGSIGGPTLWNLLLDPLLKGLDRRGDYCQAFADDVVLVFDADRAVDIQRQANAALAHVQRWGQDNKLNFAAHKTKAMIVTNKLKYDTPALSMGGVDIGFSKEIKILGLTIDDKLTFNSHVAEVCKKALNIYKQLSRAAKVSWGLHPEVIRLIYTATVEPIIMYAASAWAPATKKLGIQKHLNAVQRGFAQKLTKAYRTVSLNSALLLAGILPLDLRIQEAAALYEARRGKEPELRHGEGEVELVTAYAETPHPAEHMELEFINLVDQQQVEAHNCQAVKIYTDGSKIDGKVGAALSLWNNEAQFKAIKLKLSPYCTVYQAELLAICKATRVILDRQETSFGIFSDSRSALETIVNHNTRHPLATEARSNLSRCKSQNKTVNLFWIKAHAGLEGNEAADKLAKEAAKTLKRKPHYEQCPVSFVKRKIRMDSLAEWNRRYKSGTTASITKIFFPDAIDAYRTVRKIEINNVLTQVMTGHGGFSEYLNRFKCKESPSCTCDPQQVESIPHLLFDCPVYGFSRYELEQRAGVTLSAENAKHIIMNKEVRQAFLEYCINIANKVIARNK
ncbi:uncharacterized protein LOC119690772 [Plutella xylostella]|uniref:uncharacterized protein LOC119690772 n=1 Tax=Plutella xylostella TaxID=51655 RepID=UPI0020330863|nr:uncharacterized protein LOC119690772 [Plutella xylostella]